MLHEAVDRNGQGVPPLYAYALLGSGVAFWLLVVVILKAVNPIVLLIGFLGLCYYAALGYQKQLERARLIASRRAEGLCIFCGYPADPRMVYCPIAAKNPTRIHRDWAGSRQPRDRIQTRRRTRPLLPRPHPRHRQK